MCPIWRLMMARARSTTGHRRARHLEQLHRVHEGRERVAQLVGEHRQELVLAPVGVPEGVLGLLELGDEGGEVPLPGAQRLLGRPAVRDLLLRDLVPAHPLDRDRALLGDGEEERVIVGVERARGRKAEPERADGPRLDDERIRDDGAPVLHAMDAGEDGIARVALLARRHDDGRAHARRLGDRNGGVDRILRPVRLGLGRDPLEAEVAERGAVGRQARDDAHLGAERGHPLIDDGARDLGQGARARERRGDGLQAQEPLDRPVVAARLRHEDGPGGRGLPIE
ncbi:MAG TPA: hypothetical protein VL242_21150 [Sorangium sp.]|nr:hypothetical protein [Sorangium sp.]